MNVRVPIIGPPAPFCAGNPFGTIGGAAGGGREVVVTPRVGVTPFCVVNWKKVFAGSLVSAGDVNETVFPETLICMGLVSMLGNSKELLSVGVQVSALQVL